MCRPTLVNEVREAGFTSDGWRQYESTGRACLVCTCGTSTGFNNRSIIMNALREHAPS